MPARRKSARKRVASKKNKEIENPLPIPGRKRSRLCDETNITSFKKVKGSHDKYCWICHKPSQDKKCRCCLRVYHSACLKRSTQFDEVCYKCQEQANNREMFANKVTKVQLSEMLQAAVKRVFSEDEPDRVPLVVWQSSDNNKLCCIIDYRYIHDRAKDTESGVQYHSPGELLDDVEWMYHNCAIVYGVDSPVFKEAKEVLKQFKREFESMLDCVLCYHRKSQEILDKQKKFFFYKPCEMLHPVIWAKIDGFSHWPAKCYRVTKGKAHVQFFHTYQTGSAKLNNCYFMSKEYPCKKPKDLGFIISMEELQVYLDLFKATYGAYTDNDEYPFQPLKTRYDHNKAEEIMTEIKRKHNEKTIPCPTEEPPCEDFFNTDEEAHRKVCENSEEQTQNQISDLYNLQLVMNFLPITSQKELGNQRILENNQILVDQNISPIIYPQEKAVNGHLLPGVHKGKQNFAGCSDQLLQVPFVSEADSSISISNVVSGTDVPINISSDDLNSIDFCVEDSSVVVNDSSLQVETAQIFEASSTLPENPISVSSQVFADSSDEPNINSSEHTVSSTPCNANNSDDSDVEVLEINSSSCARSAFRRRFLNPVANDLTETILRRDPAAYMTLRDITELTHQLFVYSWGVSNEDPNAPRLRLTKENAILVMKDKIAQLEQQVRVALKKITQIKDNYEDSLRNSARVVLHMNKMREMRERNILELQEKLGKLESENTQIKEENEKLKLEMKKVSKVSDFTYKNQQEELKDAQLNDYCSAGCGSMATFICCGNVPSTFKYCSDKCRKDDDKHQVTLDCVTSSNTRQIKTVDTVKYVIEEKVETVKTCVQSTFTNNEHVANIAQHTSSMQTERVQSKRTLGMYSKK